MPPPRPGRRVRIAYDAVVGVAVIEAAACAALWHYGTGGACLAAAALAVAARAVRVHRFPPRARRRGTGPGR